ncbi:MAG: division/cell wall cluster transcriptional repressor MraZ [Pseudomonadota bacterium]|nr:division/cell wall cluster transcriptional repressor MraZ [Pseudomonadota bacterium]
MLRSAEALFLGSHINKIDAKGRIAAPADFRRALDLDRYNGFYCVPSLIGPWLDCGGTDYIEGLIAMISALDPYDPDRADLEDSLIGRSRPVPFDGDGRFILPQPLRDHAGLDDRALLIGRGETFQIRRADGAEEHLSAAAERAKNALRKLRNPAPVPMTERAR